MEIIMEFKVQKSGLAGKEWKTICSNPDKNYATEIYERQLKLYSIGRFRLLDPDDKIIRQDTAKSLFS